MFFKRFFIKKFRQKLFKIRLKNKQKILSQKAIFSKILNHDIKTVLLAQTNCLKLLLNDKFSKANYQKEIINQILSSNKFLIEIINNAIFLAEIDDKTSNLNFENVDITRQVEFCLNDIKDLAKTKNQKVIFNSKNSKISLNADKALIQKIISNLLTCSVSYGFEKSDIVVSLDENKDYISFSAKNKSAYMTKEKINNIFNTKVKNDFNQLGMKLNLNIARQLINVHNWDFILTSDKESKTSTFGFAVKKT